MDDATFLDLNITNEDNIFGEKLSDQRGKLTIFIVRMAYLSKNILWLNVFRFLQRARYTVRLTYFVPKETQLYTGLVTQSGSKKNILGQIKRGFLAYSSTFWKYCKTYDEIIKETIMYYFLKQPFSKTPYAQESTTWKILPGEKQKTITLGIYMLCYYYSYTEHSWKMK